MNDAKKVAEKRQVERIVKRVSGILFFFSPSPFTHTFIFFLHLSSNSWLKKKKKKREKVERELSVLSELVVPEDGKSVQERGREQKVGENDTFLQGMHFECNFNLLFSFSLSISLHAFFLYFSALSNFFPEDKERERERVVKIEVTGF